MNLKIAVVLTRPRDMEYYREQGLDVYHVPVDDMSEENLIEALKPYDGFICVAEPFSARVSKALEGKMKLVVRNGVGYEKIDVDAAAKSGICCCYTPGCNAAAVAEGALLLILEAQRRFFEGYYEMVVENIWNRAHTGRQLEGKTVALLGFGNIAKKLMQYLQGFNCKLIAFDPYVDAETMKQYGVEKVELFEAAELADVVSVHIPLSKATEKIIGEEFFAHMKSNAIFVNTARGGVVDQNSLIKALETGSIGGAGLDVFDPSPIEENSPLKKMKNVMISPHIAAQTKEADEVTLEIVKDIIQDYQSGKVPRFCLNPDYITYLR